MSCMGFDFGYQTSLFAVPRGGGIDVLLNDYSTRQTPSQVSFGEKQRVMGEGAKLKVVTNFKNTITYFKTLLGRKYSSPDVQAELAKAHFKHEALPDGTVGVRVRFGSEEKVFTIPQIVGMYFGHLKNCVDKELGAKTHDCVVGVPVYFNDAQRHAMLVACKIAGLNCLRLMNETTAVALNYGIYKQDLPDEKQPPRRVVFFDFGHHAVQMSLCEFVKGKLTVVTTKSVCVGGRDFDRAIVNVMADQFTEKYKVDIRSKPRALIRLEAECEKLKKQMSANSTRLPINIECLCDDYDLRSGMTRDEFEELCQPIFAQIEAAIDEFIASIRARDIALEDIAAIEIIGGCSRIPKLREILTSRFGKQLNTTLNSDEAVTRGCALMAAIVSPTFRVREFKVLDATPYAINLSWQSTSADEGESCSEIYAVDTLCNLSKILSFHRDSDFVLAASYKEPSKVPDQLQQIGNVEVRGVRPGYDGKAQKVKVKVRVNEHGCFDVDWANLMEKIDPKILEAEQAAEEQQKKEAEKPKEGDKEAPMDTGDDKADAKEGEAKAKDQAQEEQQSSETKEGEEPSKKKAKTHKSVPLDVRIVKDYVLDQKRINELVETELDMANQDRMEKEKNDARNALEEYIYDMRDKIGSIYEEFIKPADNDAFRNKLTSMEDWLYEDGDDQPKSVYVEKLQELKQTGNAVKTRAMEFETRPKAEDHLRRRIVHFRKFVDEWKAGDEKYNHLSEEEVNKVQGYIDDAEKWIDSMASKQAQLNKHDQPAVLTSEIESKATWLDTNCNPIVHKPKPKVEPPKDEEMKDAEGDNKPKEGEETTASGEENAAKPEDKAAEADAANMDVD